MIASAASGIPASTLRNRINSGLTLEQAISKGRVSRSDQARITGKLYGWGHFKKRAQ